MIEPQSKSIFLSNLHYFSAQTDGSYAFPNSAIGDLLKQAKKEIEALLEPEAKDPKIAAAELEHERDEALKYLLGALAFRRDLFALQEAQLNEARRERDEARKEPPTPTVDPESGCGIPVEIDLNRRCAGCGGAIISRLCTCGTPHPEMARRP